MKTIIKVTLATLCVASVLSLPGTAGAQEKKGGQLQRELAAIQTLEDVDALKTGDTFAMACSKCKTIWVAQVKKDAKGAELLMANGKPTPLVGKHQCNGCGGMVEITGHGKGKTAKLKHTCTSCGDESAYCCATKKGSGPTTGMDKDKKK